jgi:hypothetical protein
MVVRELEEAQGKKRVRGLYIVKSRGTGHSSDVQKMTFDDNGIHLRPMDDAATAGSDQKKKIGKSVRAKSSPD